jgi:hypothetical protein
LGFHNSHNWYEGGGLVHQNPWDSGGVAAPGWNLINNQTGAPEVLRPERRDVMPQISLTANVNVWIGDQQLRTVIRQEVNVEMSKQERRDRSKAASYA